AGVGPRGHLVRHDRGGILAAARSSGAAVKSNRTCVVAGLGKTPAKRMRSERSESISIDLMRPRGVLRVGLWLFAEGRENDYSERSYADTRHLVALCDCAVRSVEGESSCPRLCE